jgi:hypothetical protein
LVTAIEIVPAPVTTGNCGISKGPAPTRLDSSLLPLTSTSTVEGTAAEPLTEGSGKVTRSGRKLKSELICAPPRRTGRVQPRPPVMKSPTR